MSAAPIAPTTPPASLLLARPRPASLPVSAALDLVKLPLVLAMKKRIGVPAESEVAADSLDDEQLMRLPVLPEELYEVRFTTTDRFGIQHRIYITGSNRLGLPYGHDGDVLMALFALYGDDRQRVLAGQAPRIVDGEFSGISVAMIARAMGYARLDGGIAKRIRSALRRLAFVRIMASSTEFRDTRETASALLDGRTGTRPLTPTLRRPAAGGAGATSAREEEVAWLLEYRWRTEYNRTADGEAWIRRLRVNPLWLDQTASGWVAWIDMERYMSLGGPLAKRLYQLLACEAAYGTPAPWVFSVDALRGACAISPRRFANDVVKSLVPAAQELCAHGVLSSVEHRRIRNGVHELTVSPGPTLAMASLLRGASALDLHETQVQMMFLRSFGMDDRIARELIELDAAAVPEALLYALFVRDTAPGQVQRSWSKMIEERVRNGRSNAGTVGFEEWRRRQAAKLAAAPAPVRSPAPREPAAPPEPPPLPDDVWGTVLGALRQEVAARDFESWLRGTSLLRFDDDTLEVRAQSDLHAQWIAKNWGARAAELAAAAAGAPITLRVNGILIAAGKERRI